MKPLLFIGAGLLAAASLSHAQNKPAEAASTAAPAPAASANATSEAKRQLIARVLTLQQAGIAGAAAALVEQSLQGVVQGGSQLLQRLPADQREPTARQMDAEVRKYREEVGPAVRERAIRIAPGLLGPRLDANFSEEELRQLVAMLESPINRKYQQIAPELSGELTRGLVAESRPLLEPRLRALGERLSSLLGLPPPGGSAAPPPTASGPARP